MVCEPLRWSLRPGDLTEPEAVARVIRRACRGPVLDDWTPPSWLLPHQVDAARRIAGSLLVFRGGLLADAVGLGKTYVALAVSTRYSRTTVVAPSPLLPQWKRVSAALGVPITLVSDQSLSRGRTPPAGDLLVVDEAHRFRNPETRRYDMLARRAVKSDLLLVTATPVVNRVGDLVALLTLFLPDSALAAFGVRSIRTAAAARQYGEIARAAGPVVVARTPGILNAAGIPLVQDSAIAIASPLPAAELPELLARIESLKFPTFLDRGAAGLLRQHLVYRLASSAAALEETVERHLAYLRRAIAAAENGERLSRQDAHALFDPDDDGQLFLDLQTGGPSPVVDATTLIQERDRLIEMRDWLKPRRRFSPKADHLVSLIAARSLRKTLIFTVAVTTARDLASRLGWRRLALVTGRGAWIASGPIPVETALGLFAPRARSAPDPGPAALVQVLIATDLASEGLDLQDADGVVHYDLPWTPLRLQQRLGRIARLGSAHRAVDVSWFGPPPQIETLLRLSLRLERKSADQVQLGVPVSSRVGIGTILARAVEARERLAQPASVPGSDGPIYATVSGPPAAAFVLRWRARDRIVRDTVVIQQGKPVDDLSRCVALLQALLDGSFISAPIPQDAIASLLRIVRRRMAATADGSVDPLSLRLARHVARRAAWAGRRREQPVLGFLDALLNRIHQGITEGERRNWEAKIPILSAKMGQEQLAAFRTGWTGPFSVTLEAALFGIPGRPLSSRPGK